MSIFFSKLSLTSRRSTVKHLHFGNCFLHFVWNRSYSGNRYGGASVYGRGDGPIFIDKLDCQSTDRIINDCSYSTVPQCTENNIAWVECYGTFVFMIYLYKKTLVKLVKLGFTTCQRVRAYINMGKIRIMNNSVT